MNADIKGALRNFTKSWKCFEHNGEPMKKHEVKAVLEYGVKVGYKTTNDFKEGEVDKIINHLRKTT